MALCAAMQGVEALYQVLYRQVHRYTRDQMSKH
jgi:hypothetical protein